MACGAVQGAEEERRERGGQGGRGGRDVEEDEDEVAEDQREIEGVLVQDKFDCSLVEQEAGRGGRTAWEEEQEGAEDEEEPQVGRKPFANPLNEISTQKMYTPYFQHTVKVSTSSSR